MNLLFLGSLYSPHVGGSAEIVLQRLVEGMQGRGHQVCVLVTGPEAGLHEERVRGIKVFRAGLLNTYWHYSEQQPTPLARLGWHLRDRYNAGMRQFLNSVVCREQIELVVCHTLSGWSVAVWDELFVLGMPIVQVLDDWYPLCIGSNMLNGGSRCKEPCPLCRNFRQGHAQRSAQIDAVVSPSRFLLERLQAAGYFPNALTRIIVNSRPADEDNVVHLPRGRVLEGEWLRFGFLGTLSRPKGLPWLIEQFKRLPFNATLQIAGRGRTNDEQELKHLARECKNIQFVGYQPPNLFYQNIDVAVVPSIWDEPYAMVAVQACAQSVPVIASQRGGLPEIIIDNENGLLCDPDDPDSLGLAMLRLNGDPTLRQSLASRARASVATWLDLEGMLDRYDLLFQEVLHKRGALHAANTP